jgi:hypothetical protein
MSLAVVVWTMTPSASAHTDDPADTPVCPDPQVQVSDYDTERFVASATLLASGCPAREQRQFPLWLSVTRYEETSAHGVARGVLCGPFRSSSEGEARRYSCDVDLALDHPEVEAATYQVEVSYPGADGDETMAFEVFCVSEDGSYGCELQDDPEATGNHTSPRSSA